MTQKPKLIGSFVESKRGEEEEGKGRKEKGTQLLNLANAVLEKAATRKKAGGE